jgi:hypothetical protein
VLRFIRQQGQCGDHIACKVESKLILWIVDPLQKLGFHFGEIPSAMKRPRRRLRRQNSAVEIGGQHAMVGG